MKDFIFDVKTKILFGEDQLENLGREIKKYGNKVLLCYGTGSIKKNGIYDDIVGELKKDGIEYFELAGIEPNPRVDSAREGIRLVREHGISFILAVGGGSTIDCAKLIAGGYKLDCDPWNILTGKAKIEEALPIGVVLTLSATGSEMDDSAVITNLETKEKLAFASAHVLPKFALMNPKYTFTVPKYHTAAGTADIMSHTMENYFTLDDCYFQDGVAEAILKTCVKYGRRAMDEPENYEARANLMWASTWAINGLLSTGKSADWSVHPIEHEVSAYFDITHGVGLAIITPRWLEYCMNEDTTPKIARFAREVFEVEERDDKKAAELGILALYKFFESLDIPMHLRDTGVTEDKLEEMAKMTIEHKRRNIRGFVELSEEAVLEILRKSF